MKLIFEWDVNKAAANLQKHKISFDEARTIFDDAFLVTFPDEFHSDEETRFISIGRALSSRILLVVHTENDFDENALIVRIISCRKATVAERKFYE